MSKKRRAQDGVQCILLDHGVQDVTAVNVLVNFYPLIDENQRGLPGGTIFDPNHHGLWILAVPDDSRRAESLGEPFPVVLMIVGLFDGE